MIWTIKNEHFVLEVHSAHLSSFWARRLSGAIIIMRPTSLVFILCYPNTNSNSEEYKNCDKINLNFEFKGPIYKFCKNSTLMTLNRHKTCCSVYLRISIENTNICIYIFQNSLGLGEISSPYRICLVRRNCSHIKFNFTIVLWRDWVS